jgi:thiol-disulfide isomerase/thioredoxin
VCQAEQPHLNQLAEEYEGQAVFFGVSNQDTVEDGKQYEADYGVPYALGHAPEVWELFNDPVRPTTIVIGADGAIATEITGPVTYEGLKKDIEAAL